MEGPQGPWTESQYSRVHYITVQYITGQWGVVTKYMGSIWAANGAWGRDGEKEEKYCAWCWNENFEEEESAERAPAEKEVIICIFHWYISMNKNINWYCLTIVSYHFTLSR